MSIHKGVFFYVPFLLIFLGFYRNSWIPGGHTLVGNEIWLYFLVSSIYLILILDFEKLLNLKLNLFSVYNKYIFALFVLLVISTLFYNIQEFSTIRSLFRFINYILYFIIFFYFVPEFLNSNPQFFRKFVLIISQIGLFTAAFGLVLFFADIAPDPKFAGTLVSFIDQPNYVVFIMNLGIMATIYYFDWRKENLSLVKKVFFISSIFIQFAATLLTLSRGGYIGIGIGLVVYFMFKFRSKIILILPFLVTIAVIIIPPFFKAKGFGSFLSRLYLLVPAYYMITRDYGAMMWGYGITNSLEAFLKYNRIYNVSEFHLNNPHNAIVSMILMFGMAFTLLMIFFVSLLLKRVSVKAFKENDTKKSLFYAFIISTITTLVFQSIFDSEIVIIEFFSLQYLLIFLGLLRENAERFKSSNLVNYVC